MKKVASVFLIFSLFFSSTTLIIGAHPSELNVEYDPCLPAQGSDGYFEKWYDLINTHIPHANGDEVSTIKYYFSPHGKNDSSLTWSTGLTYEQSNMLVENYISSMEKWNNVYFYQNDASGNLVQKKLVNIVPGTYNDYNVIIYPAITPEIENPPQAYVQVIEETAYNSQDETHFHVDSWEMFVHLTAFFDEETGVENPWSLRKVGAHEIGHILGLGDIDANENSNTNNYHHMELLMGYACNYPPQTNITYKDLVGVAITRGYHTDADHKWICVEDDPDEIVGEFRLICSICNGVKMVDSLIGYNYVMLNACNKNHELSSGNMMAVASYGNKDYYKCKYCRYVAPFGYIVQQDYVISQYSNTHHACVNQVQGLGYTLLEPHNINSDNVCVDCNAHVHRYGAWTFKNSSYHQCLCALCGNVEIAPHVISPGDAGKRFARCLDCNAMLDLHENQESIMSYTQLITLNGSYILPNGIIVLADEDAEAYYNGTLVFYKKDDVPEME